MNNKEKENKIINFLQDFSCATQEQLINLFGKNIDFGYILGTENISKKGNIYVHNLKTIDKKMIAALDVLCNYKDSFKQYHNNFDPIYITFLSKENILYHIIVADKNNEKGVVKLLNDKTSFIHNADKLILLFTDSEMYSNIECETDYLYCTYPPVQIV